MHNRPFFGSLAVVLAAIFLFLGCGYHFKGKENNLPKDIRTVAIPIFKNNTTETNIENYFTDALIAQFVRGKELKLVDVKNADAIIYGVLTEYHDETLTYSNGGRVSQYRVSVAVQISLVRAKTGKVIWRAKRLTDFADYDASTNTIVNEARKKEAIQKVAEFLAEIIHDRMLENF